MVAAMKRAADRARHMEAIEAAAENSEAVRREKARADELQSRIDEMERDMLLMRAQTAHDLDDEAIERAALERAAELKASGQLTERLRGQVSHRALQRAAARR